MRSAAPPSRSERDRLVRKLESIGDMSADEKAAIYESPMQVRTLADGEDIVLEGERPSQCCLILTDIRRIAGRFREFSVPLRRAARKFNRWLAVPAAKSLGLPPQRAGAHRAAFIRAHLDPHPCHICSRFDRVLALFDVLLKPPPLERLKRHSRWRRGRGSAAPRCWR